MRTSNILMSPGQFMHQPGYPGNYPRSSDIIKHSTDNILPPLEYKNRPMLSNNEAELSTANNLSNKRLLSPAPVLPNLKSVIESLSGENLNSLKSNSIINSSSAKKNSAFTQQFVVPAPFSIGNNNTHYSAASTGNVLNAARANTVYRTQQQSQLPSSSQYNLSSPIKFIINRGCTIYQGDHVSIRGSDSQIYFALVVDFWLTENGKRYCTLRWLLPNPKASFTSALHERFSLGPIHDRVEAMETILDVFYSPYRDQMTAESIRKRYFLPNEYESTGVLASVDPPPILLRAIKSLSSNSSDHNCNSETETARGQLSATSSTLPSLSSSSTTSHQSSPSSRLLKSSDEVQLNPIVAESSEIAAKMLLSMN